MKDYLGNDVHEGDTVIVAIKSGRTATLGRAWVLQEELRPQYAGGTPANMLQIKWSNFHIYWIPASHVVKIPDEMLPEKRKEKLDNVNEGIRVS